MLYAADIVLTHQTRTSSKSPAIMRRLTMIQQQAARLITGATPSTAADILDVHACLTPMVLEAQRHCQRAAARLTTLSEEHPLSKPVQNAACNSRQFRHFSPLHDLMRSYGLKPREMEKCKVVQFEASWDPKLEIRISESREEALEMIQRDGADIQVFVHGQYEAV